VGLAPVSSAPGEAGAEPGVRECSEMVAGFGYACQHNSFDFRDVERDYVKPDGCTGSPREVWANEQGTRRYFPEAERILLKQNGVRPHPNLILVGVLLNNPVGTYLAIGAVTRGT